jgi:hypothetical protein
MREDFVALAGLVFTEPTSGTDYGRIRPVDPSSVEADDGTVWLVLAEDEAGNAFLADPNGRIAFWDHETDDLVELASSFQAFADGCSEPSPVELDPKQVKSVWIDPAFAKELGIDVPADGWKKKPEE